MIKTLLKSGGIVSLMTLLSRIFGLIRDIVIAKLFGANLYTDAFFIAFKIPNFLRRLFAEGAFSQAFVPILSHVKASNNEQEVVNVINVIGSKLLMVLIVITAIAMIAAPLIVFIFASGFYNTEKFDLTVLMLRITFPYLLFISLTAFAGGILNTYNRFAAPAFTPVLLNISMILFALFATEHLQIPIVALAWGVLVGGLAQLLFQIPFLIKIKRLPKLSRENHPQVAVLKKRMLPALLGVSASQINLLIDTILASYLVSGSVTWLYYANRLFEFPLALLGVALATVSLPALSRYYRKSQLNEFKQTIDGALKLSIIFALPASFGLVFLSEPLLITLFQYDAFSAEDVKQASLALTTYGVGLFAFILVKILTPVFYAQGNTKTPVKVSLTAIAVNIVLNLALISEFKHVGLAMATSIAAFVNASMLYFFLKKQGIYHLERPLIVTLIKVLIACVIMVVMLEYISFDSAFWLAQDVWQRGLLLTEHIISAALVYFAILFVLNVSIKR